MSSGALKAVLFDMDGTLLDSERIWEEGLQDLCAYWGCELDPVLRKDMVGMDQTDSMRLLHHRLNLPAEAIPNSTRWLIDRMDLLFSKGVAWRPGAQELLHSVRRSGYASALVTATGRRLVNIIIDTMGAHNFDVSVVGDEVGKNKPHPEPYVTAIKSLGVTVSECIAIEDSVTGVASATEAGCVVLGVPSECSLPSSSQVRVVDSLQGVDVPALVKIHSELIGSVASPEMSPMGEADWHSLVE